MAEQSHERFLLALSEAQNSALKIANSVLDEQREVIKRLNARLAFVDSMFPVREMTHEEIVADRHILVDLDGTLAEYKGWQGADHIGAPIGAMLKRVLMWVKQGHKVKIFTARAHAENQIPVIKEWLKEAGLPDLEITCVKRPSAIEIWDDLAVRILKNTGKDLLEETRWESVAFKGKAEELHSTNNQLKAEIEQLKTEIKKGAADKALLSELRKMVGVE